jgi:hypothetical protein
VKRNSSENLDGSTIEENGRDIEPEGEIESRVADYKDQTMKDYWTMALQSHISQ